MEASAHLSDWFGLLAQRCIKNRECQCVYGLQITADLITFTKGKFVFLNSDSYNKKAGKT